MSELPPPDLMDQSGRLRRIVLALIVGGATASAMYGVLYTLADPQHQRTTGAFRSAPVGLLTGWPDGVRDYRDHRLAFALLKPVSRDTFLEQLAMTLEITPLDEPQRVTLREYFRCIEEHAYDRLYALCAPDVVYRLPGDHPRLANKVRGLDEFVAFTRRTFEMFVEPRFSLHSLRPLPRGAIVEYTGSWLEGESRRSMPGAVMFELEGSLITRIDVRVDADVLS